MKKLTISFDTFMACMVFLCLLLITGCRKDLLKPNADIKKGAITVAEAKQYFETNFQNLKPNTLSSTSQTGNIKASNEKVPMWEASQLRRLNIGIDAVFTPLICTYL